MKRPVEWSRDALDELKEQIAYIALENPAAARRVANRIRSAATALGKRAIGRPGRVAGTYEKRVIGLPYILAYAISTRMARETVFTLRVIHLARDWSAEEWPA